MAVRFAAGRGAGISAAIAYIAANGLGYGMMYPLLTLLLERQGESGFLIGVSTMAQAVGSLIITPVLPALMARVGLTRLMLLAAAVEAVMFLALFLQQDVWTWMPIRVVLGMSASVAFYGSEYWLVALAPSRSRGRIVGVYSLVASAALALGPMLLAGVGFEGFTPFAVPMLLSVVGAAPVFLARRHAPGFTGRGSLGEVPRFILANPTICFAVILFGGLEAAMLGLFPAWGLRAGLAPTAAVVLIGVAGLGTTALQPLLGIAADRRDRRSLLAVCALCCAALTLALAAFSGFQPALWAAVFLWGGFSAGLYTVALVELGARHEGRTLAVGNAALVMGYSVGALAAPPIAGGMMDAIPPHGMLYFLAAASALYLLLPFMRGPRRGCRAR